MIKIDNVSKEYLIGGEKFLALDKINLEVKDGEFCSIVGPSGSGKSTLMHMIGLLDKPSTGQILINNQNVAKFSDDHLSRLRNEFVGFVFQQFNLINKLTVLENVLLPVVYSRRKLSFDPRERADNLLARFGISDRAGSYPNKISGGQQQRAAIARALIMKPGLVLADEPTGNLDTKTGEEILKLLTQLNREEKVSVIIVTHDPKIAQRTKRRIKIQDGRIIK